MNFKKQGRDTYTFGQLMAHLHSSVQTGLRYLAERYQKKKNSTHNNDNNNDNNDLPNI